jgi:hypothetical protein
MHFFSSLEMTQLNNKLESTCLSLSEWETFLVLFGEYVVQGESETFLVFFGKYVVQAESETFLVFFGEYVA